MPARFEQENETMSIKVKTAAEAGWHLSRYNLSAPVPGKETVAIVNLFRGNCAEYSSVELYLLSVLESLPEDHPIIERFSKRGIITRMDELAALEAMGRAACLGADSVALTICPTMNCNFDCPYCFERHRPGRMSKEVQDDVVSLAERMLDFCRGKKLNVVWFGGEPLLEAGVIERLSERLMTVAEQKHADYTAEIVTNGYLLTQKNVDMLARYKVDFCQITIDSLGAAHDAVRHLKGGGATFKRITDNLRSVKIPFRVSIRQNVQESNLDEVPEVGEYVRKLAEESGNQITCYPSPVTANGAAKERGGRVSLLCGTDLSEIGLMKEVRRFRTGHGHFCGAHTLMSIGIDEKGQLFKCWEDAGEDAYAFGNVHDWDPKDPLNTASDPDKLTMYLNTALPGVDEECRECVWLPMCAGGCPQKRLLGEKRCVAFRDEPECYVLALYKRMKEEKNGSDAGV